MNVPETIALVLSSPYVKVTLHELDTVYGVEDLWWFIEVHCVSAFNQSLANQKENA